VAGAGTAAAWRVALFGPEGATVVTGGVGTAAVSVLEGFITQDADTPG
jgi:hypothetical protein